MTKGGRRIWLGHGRKTTKDDTKRRPPINLPIYGRPSTDKDDERGEAWIRHSRNPLISFNLNK
jgi:hypothetical protein